MNLFLADQALIFFKSHLGIQIEIQQEPHLGIETKIQQETKKSNIQYHLKHNPLPSQTSITLN